MTRYDLELHAERNLTRILSADLYGSIDRQSYTDGGFHSTDYSVGSDISLKLGRTLSCRLRYVHDSRGAVGGGYGYAENRIFALVSWTPLSETSSVAGRPSGP